VRVDSPFTALLQLSRGLQGDDRQAVQAAAQRLDRTLQNMQQVQGQMASQAKTMADRTERVDTETTAARTLLSDVQDVDFTDATLRFQQLQTALQANLVTGSKLMSLSLLNFLT
jgi:flagellin-like hook-associated protein FlgL